MMQLLSKSAVAREEGISRRTVQRRCRTWESLPKTGEYQVMDEKGRVNLEEYRRFDKQVFKRYEKRGFPLRGVRTPTHRWRRLMRALRDKKTFGRTLEDRFKLIRAEIDAMSDGEQMATLAELPIFFRSAVRQSLVKLLTKHLGNERDNLA
jgi:hypothetical protein